MFCLPYSHFAIPVALQEHLNKKCDKKKLKDGGFFWGELRSPGLLGSAPRISAPLFRTTQRGLARQWEGGQLSAAQFRGSEKPLALIRALL